MHSKGLLIIPEELSTGLSQRSVLRGCPLDAVLGVALATDMSAQSTLGDTDAYICKLSRDSQHKILEKHYARKKKDDFGRNLVLRGIKTGHTGCFSININPVQKYSQCI